VVLLVLLVAMVLIEVVVCGVLEATSAKERLALSMNTQVGRGEIGG